MYIWRKRATAGWLRKRNNDLRERFGGQLAIIEQPGKALALVEISCATRKQAVKLRRELGGTFEMLRPDWFRRFAKQQRSKVLRIGSRLIINPMPNLKAANTIVIPAEAAFGTGEHATTAMCLRMLERVTRERRDNWRMLDAGTGSGILAIAGSRFGGKRIVAIDNDPLAYSIAQRNARANHVRNIDFRIGDVLEQKFDYKFDIITANLFSEILIAALPNWSRHLEKDGCLILSGVLRPQERALVAALRQHGFCRSEVKRRGKWIALLASRTTKRS